MESVRAFIAIELDAEILTALGDLQDRLRLAPLARLGRWVAPAGIHLTLKFLGDVPRGRLPALRSALAAACSHAAPFDLAVACLGFFPNAQRLRVIWVGVEEPAGVLQRLQLAVERELNALGFRPEGRAFTPHLTLARIRDEAQNRERAELGAWISQHEAATGRLGAMRVQEVCLVQSELRPSGAVYTILATVPLQPGEE